MSSTLEAQAVSEASLVSFLRRQFAKPNPLPELFNLHGQVAIITGSSSGLGLEAARQFLACGISHVVLAVRSQSRGNAAAEWLRKLYPSAEVSVSLVDMTSYESIQSFVERCRLTLSRIDILILNAGTQKSGFVPVTTTGHETMMQVNFLSTALLAILSLPLLKLKRHPDATRPPTLSIVGSDLSYTVDLNLEASSILEEFDNSKGFSQFDRYAKTKLLLMFYVPRLAETVNSDDVIVNITNPGMTKSTNIFHDSSWLVVKMSNFLNLVLGRSVDIGASNYIYSSAILGQESHGSFTSDWAIKPFPKVWYTSKGQETSHQLWEETMNELKAFGVLDILKGIRCI